jgi:hypothetical protein
MKAGLSPWRIHERGGDGLVPIPHRRKKKLQGTSRPRPGFLRFLESAVSYLFLFILLLAGVVGCSRSGDFGGFLVREVTRFGGHTKTNVTSSNLEAHWTIKRDKNGFQAAITGTSFASIDTFMRQSFGAPKMSTDGAATATGQPHRVWAAVDIGVAIQLVGRPGGADIICVRAMSMGQMFQEMDKPWWKKLW